jgi:hypothetical protein
MTTATSVTTLLIVLDSGRTVPTGTLPDDALSNICPTSIDGG